MPIATVSQLAYFLFLMLISIGCFVALASPYGWPYHSFVQNVPSNVQIFLAFFLLGVYSLPIVISGIFYILLVCAQSKNFKNNVGVVLDPNNFELVNNISNCVQEKKDCDSKTKPSDVPLIGQHEYNEIKSVEYDYNKILMESGMPYETMTQDPNSIEDGLFQQQIYACSSKDNSLASDSIQIQTLESKTLSILTLVSKNNGKGELMHNSKENQKAQAVNNDFQNEEMTGNQEMTTNEEMTANEEMTTNDQITTNEDLKNVERHLAEKAAAIKSLKTNLILILICCLTLICVFFPSKLVQTYFFFFSSSIQRAMLPIVTTMANFGTIQSVALQFWNILVKN